MRILPRESWTFTGQPTKEWPRWLVWTNYATDFQKIIIHRLEEPLVVQLGDTIQRDTQGDLFVIRAEPALQSRAA